MSNSAEYAIKVENVSFTYPKAPEDTDDGFSLKDLNLGISKGEFVAVLGHNGSGKSTLAKLLNALLVPTDGKVYVNGIDTSDPEKTWDIRSSTGMVFQNPDNQIIATIVEEDVAFGAENLGIAPAEIRKRVDSALNSMGIYKLAKSSPHFLSGGQKQRVAIAGILAMRPSCIIFDEPTAMLDPQGRKEVMEAIRVLKHEEGITVVLITHFMDEAVMADRVVLMDGGMIKRIGTPKEIFSGVDELKSIGLDVPQVTECINELKKAGYSFPDGLLTVEEAVEAVEAVVMEKVNKNKPEVSHVD